MPLDTVLIDLLQHLSITAVVSLFTFTSLAHGDLSKQHEEGKLNYGSFGSFRGVFVFFWVFVFGLLLFLCCLLLKTKVAVTDTAQSSIGTA